MGVCYYPGQFNPNASEIYLAINRHGGLDIVVADLNSVHSWTSLDLRVKSSQDGRITVSNHGQIRENTDSGSVGWTYPHLYSSNDLWDIWKPRKRNKKDAQPLRPSIIDYVLGDFKLLLITRNLLASLSQRLPSATASYRKHEFVIVESGNLDDRLAKILFFPPAPTT